MSTLSFLVIAHIFYGPHIWATKLPDNGIFAGQKTGASQQNT
jgi:hypothetical protein